MIDLIVGYFLISAFLLSRSILVIEESISVLKNTRSRELKVTTKLMLSHQIKDMMLCVAWPYVMARAAKSIFLYIRDARDKK